MALGILFLVVYASLFFYCHASTSDALRASPDFFLNVGGVHYFLCHEKDAVDGQVYLSSQSLLSCAHIFPLSSSRPPPTPQFRGLNPPQRIGLFLDLQCSDAFTFIRTTGQKWMNGSYEWVLSGGLSQLESFLKDTEVGLSTRMTLLSNEREVVDVFRVHPTSPLSISTRGRWLPGQTPHPMSPPDSRSDFKGVTLKASVLMVDIEIEKGLNITRLLDPSYMEGRDAMRRYSLALYLHLPAFFNYTVNYTVSRTWGEPQKNGSYTGLLGQLQRNEIDYGTGLMKHVPYRYPLLDYLTSLSSVKVCFSFLQPKLIGSPKALIIPLSPVVWAYLGGLCLVSAVVFVATGLYDTTSKNNEGISGGFLLTLAALAQQGIPDDTWKPSTRILYLFYLWMTFMVAVYYNTAVLNGLLLPAPNAIQTFEQLLKSNLRFGVTDLEYHKAELKENGTKLRLFRERVEKKQKGQPLYFNTPDAVEFMKNSSFAYYSEDENLYSAVKGKLTDAQICGLSEIIMSTFQVAGAVADNSHYKEMFNRAFLLMKERGILKRASDQWHVKKPFCQWKQDAISFSLKPVAVAFLVLALGIALTFLFLILEILHRKSHPASVKFFN